MTTDKVTPDHLRRRAIVYVRQSTVIQVLHNLESQRRQYNLAEYARELGFIDVVTIDEDLGKSGSGLVERPGMCSARIISCSPEVCARRAAGATGCSPAFCDADGVGACCTPTIPAAAIWFVTPAGE
jgi:hypothetical protein